MPRRALALARWLNLEPFVVPALEMASTLLWTGASLATKRRAARGASRRRLLERGVVYQALSEQVFSEQRLPLPPLS